MKVANPHVPGQLVYGRDRALPSGDPGSAGHRFPDHVFLASIGWGWSSRARPGGDEG